MILLEKKNNIILNRFSIDKAKLLVEYFDNLSMETKLKFAPHLFDYNSIIDLYRSNVYSGYIAQQKDEKEIIAYAVVKQGFLENDYHRLALYGMVCNEDSDCIFAPSVADIWQNKGIGNSLIHFVFDDLKQSGIKRIILWGGVQAENYAAINYYIRNGFRALGQFYHNGSNYDMICRID